MMIRVSQYIDSVLIIAAISLGFSTATCAQVRDMGESVSRPNENLSFDFVGLHLDDALRILIRQAGLNIGYDPNMLEDKESDCRIDKADIDAVLDCLLSPHDLTYSRLSSHVYVVSEREASQRRKSSAKNESTRKATVSGFIRDAATGEVFIGAHLFEPKLGLGTVTNTYGFYSLTMAADTVDLTVSYLGYRPTVHRFFLGGDMQFDIELERITIESTAVEVSATRENRIENRSDMSTMSIPIQQVKSMPVVLGEIDVLRSLQLLPGVHSGSEGSSGLYVRGGSPDQTLILLDGARVYNPSHLFGLFSVFNGDAVKHVKLIKGGFPARYGGRLSSVLEIGMKEGNKKAYAAEAAVGAVASRLMVEGPLVKNKASFILSTRRTYVDALIAPFLPDDERIGLFFYDINAKVNYNAGTRDRFFLSIYQGRDRYGAETHDEYEDTSVFTQWGNFTTTARWNHVLTNKLFSNVTGTYSRYRFDISVDQVAKFIGDESFKLDYLSGITDWGLKADLDYLPGPSHYVRLGLEGTYHTFRPGATVAKVSLDEDEFTDLSLEPAATINGFEYAAYLEDDFRVTNRLKFNAGVHVSGFVVDDQHFTSFEPRATMRYMLPEGIALKASYAKMKQYVLLLTNSSAGLPTDLWLPVTRRVPPQTSDQIALGLARSFSPGYEISVEGYYKWMHQLIEYKEGASFLGIDKDWQNKIESGNGRSRGFEVLVQKKSGRTTGWIGYTWSWADRKFENLNFGRLFPYKYDHRHDFAAVVIYKISPRLEVSGNWVYSTGNAVTLATTTYRRHPFVDGRGCFESDCLVDTFSERNNYRHPAHHRLDVAVNYSPTASGNQMLTAGVYNAYNRKNPFFIYKREEDGQLRQFSLLPVLPYVTYRRSF